MGEVIEFPLQHEGCDATVAILRAVRERDGTDTAIEFAQAMIFAATTIISHERGRDRAREVLDLAEMALPVKRGRRA